MNLLKDALAARHNAEYITKGKAQAAQGFNTVPAGTAHHHDDGTDVDCPQARLDSAGHLEKYPIKIHGAYDELLQLCTIIMPELGAGSKDANLLVDDIMVDLLGAANGQKAIVKFLDCGPCGRNATVLAGLPQYLVDHGFADYVMFVLYWNRHSKGSADKIFGAISKMIKMLALFSIDCFASAIKTIQSHALADLRYHRALILNPMACSDWKTFLSDMYRLPPADSLLLTGTNYHIAVAGRVAGLGADADYPNDPPLLPLFEPYAPPCEGLMSFQVRHSDSSTLTYFRTHFTAAEYQAHVAKTRTGAGCDRFVADGKGGYLPTLRPRLRKDTVAAPQPVDGKPAKASAAKAKQILKVRANSKSLQTADLTDELVHAMVVPTLKAWLGAWGQPTTGKKKELLQRLLDCLHAEAKGVAESKADECDSPAALAAPAATAAAAAAAAADPAEADPSNPADANATDPTPKKRKRKPMGGVVKSQRVKLGYNCWRQRDKYPWIVQTGDGASATWAGLFGSLFPTGYTDEVHDAGKTCRPKNTVTTPATHGRHMTEIFANNMAGRSIIDPTPVAEAGDGGAQEMPLHPPSTLHYSFEAINAQLGRRFNDINQRVYVKDLVEAACQDNAHGTGVPYNRVPFASQEAVRIGNIHAGERRRSQSKKQDWLVGDLRAECVRLGLDSSGVKGLLVARLLAADVA